MASKGNRHESHASVEKVPPSATLVPSLVAPLAITLADLDLA
jgi:hypothetical protein